MANKKTKTRKRRLTGMAAAMAVNPKTGRVTLEPVLRVLANIIKSGRDVTPQEKNLLAKLHAQLKE